jgi:hypothetical protein
MREKEKEEKKEKDNKKNKKNIKKKKKKNKNFSLLLHFPIFLSQLLLHPPSLSLAISLSLFFCVLCVGEGKDVLWRMVSLMRRFQINPNYNFT